MEERARMEAHRDRQDMWHSVLLLAAAIGLAAGLYLVAYETLYRQLSINLVAAGIAAASALSVFVRRRWVGGVVVALSLVVTYLLLTADFYTVQAVVSAIVAGIAGMVMLAVTGTSRE